MSKGINKNVPDESKIPKIIEMIEGRMRRKEDMLETIAPQLLDRAPDEIMKFRDQEAMRIRLVIQEQQDILEIINLIYAEDRKT